MSRKEDLRAALESQQPEGAVPIWEIHFHCWNQASARGARGCGHVAFIATDWGFVRAHGRAPLPLQPICVCTPCSWRLSRYSAVFLLDNRSHDTYNMASSQPLKYDPG